MGLFNKKKKDDNEISVLRERREIQKMLAAYEEKHAEEIKAPSTTKFSLESAEYKQFRGEEAEAKKPKTTFEKAARWAAKTVPMQMKKKDAEKVNEILYFIGYGVRADEILSLSIVLFLAFLITGGPLMLFFFPLGAALILIGVTLLIGIPQFPKYLQRIYTVELLNTMPLAIMYMVIYLRSQPTLEGAVRFASRHLTGTLSRDLKRLMWNLETGAYLSMDAGLRAYADKWRVKNKNFATAIELLRNSQRVGNEKERLHMLDESANIILQGNLAMMQMFSRSLKMPLMILYMMGIVLPVMGLVMAPIITTLMATGLSADFLVLIYNIGLPALIYFFAKWVLSSRPGSFSMPDITDYPGLPKPGHYVIQRNDKEIQIPLLPIAIAIFVGVSIPGIHLILTFPTEPTYSLVNIFKSMTFIWGAAAAVIVYTLGSSVQKLKIRENIVTIEQELDVALYAMSQRLTMGTPIENAVATAASSMKASAIQELLQKVSQNMQTMGMTLDRALFDPEAGALRLYPSRLVRTVMEVIVESSRKGLQATAVSMTTIGKYLKNLKSVQDSMTEMISGTVNAMKFQAQFLTSFIAGIIISLNILLFKILTELSGSLTDMAMPTDVTSAGVTGVFENSFFNVAGAVPAEHMQLIVGVYMLEVTILLSMMINGVEKGRDDIHRNYMIGMNLLISTIVYTVALIIGIFMFGGIELGI